MLWGKNKVYLTYRLKNGVWGGELFFKKILNLPGLVKIKNLLNANIFQFPPKRELDNFLLLGQFTFIVDDICC